MTTEEILDFVSDFYTIDIKSKTRKIDYVDARCIFFYYARNYAKDVRSLDHIGNMCGNRDHATVIHNLKRYEDRYNYDDAFNYKARLFHNAFTQLESYEPIPEREQLEYDEVMALKKRLAHFTRIKENMEKTVVHLNKQKLKYQSRCIAAENERDEIKAQNKDYLRN